ncbi:MAG: hypoxanthine phosphoribosyltransferase [Planctomycetes bacterium]|nr:hypoxanthine phosphoribosyltransferase [Planctomycetota bacterium]
MSGATSGESRYLLRGKIPRVLIPQSRINKTVKRLAVRISKDYPGKRPILISILNGAFVFTADLMRQLTIPSECHFIKLSSYGNRTVSSGKVKIVIDLPANIKRSLNGRDVIIVDDIIDTGLTTKYLKARLKRLKPRTVRLCALLDKPSRRKVKVKIDYCGFRIPDKFVVGYGIDYQEDYRYLPYIGYIQS